MPKYRKKPVIVEAVQWWKDGDHPGIKKDGANRAYIMTYREAPNNWEFIMPGDYIIPGEEKGTLCVISRKDFEATYELVENEA